MCIFGLFNIGFLGQEIKRIIREAREKVCDMSAATKVTSDSTGTFVYSFFFIYLAKYEEALCRDSYSSNGRPSSRVNDIHLRNMYTYCTSLISYNRHRHLQHYRFDSFFFRRIFSKFATRLVFSRRPGRFQTCGLLETRNKVGRRT